MNDAQSRRPDHPTLATGFPVTVRTTVSQRLRHLGREVRIGDGSTAQ